MKLIFWSNSDHLLPCSNHFFPKSSWNAIKRYLVIKKYFEDRNIFHNPRFLNKKYQALLIYFISSFIQDKIKILKHFSNKILIHNIWLKQLNIYWSHKNISILNNINILIFLRIKRK